MKRYRAGFSLIELLIGIVLIAVLMSAVAPMLQVSLLSYRQSLSYVQTHQTARIAMEAMVRDLRWAIAITRPTIGETLSYVRFSRTNNLKEREEVVFQKGTSSGLHPDTLYRVVGNASPSPLTEDTMVLLQFKRTGPGTLLLALTVRDNLTGLAENVESLVECLNVPEE